MSTIGRLGITSFAIRNDLLNNKNIRKLLFYGSTDALQKPDIERAVVERHIRINPYINSEDPDDGLGVNAFIAIYPTRAITREDNSKLVYFRIATYINQDMYLLDGNKMRLNEITEEITNTIEHKKYALSGIPSVDEIEWVSLDNSKKMGLVSLWSVIDSD